MRFASFAFSASAIRPAGTRRRGVGGARRDVIQPNSQRARRPKGQSRASDLLDCLVTAMTPVMAMTVAAVVDPKHAVDAADNSTNSSADRATHGTADRPGRPVALTNTFIRAAFHAANDALGVSHHRDRKNGQSRRNKRKTPISWREHEQSFGFHPEISRRLQFEPLS